jgi:hypothetical protein
MTEIRVCGTAVGLPPFSIEQLYVQMVHKSRIVFVAMLSSVLCSAKAIAVNIEIMRTFVRMRKLAFSNEEPARKIDEPDRRVSKHDKAIAEIIEAIHQLMMPPSRGALRT